MGNLVGALLASFFFSLGSVIIGAMGHELFSVYNHRICWMFFAISLFFCFCSICTAFYAGGIA